jgi:hypothetical protein
MLIENTFLKNLLLLVPNCRRQSKDPCFRSRRLKLSQRRWSRFGSVLGGYSRLCLSATYGYPDRTLLVMLPCIAQDPLGFFPQVPLSALLTGGLQWRNCKRLRRPNWRLAVHPLACDSLDYVRFATISTAVHCAFPQRFLVLGDNAITRLGSYGSEHLKFCNEFR